MIIKVIEFCMAMTVTGTIIQMILGMECIIRMIIITIIEQ